MTASKSTRIEKGNHHDDEDGVENALRDHHDNACCHIAKLFHGVGGDGGNVTEAILVEVAHGQVTQVFGDFDALGGASAVTALGLPHAHDAFGDGCSDKACHHDPKRKPDSIHGKRRFALYMTNDALQHDGHGTDAERHEEGIENPHDDRAVELVAIFRVAKSATTYCSVIFSFRSTTENRTPIKGAKA